MYDVCLLTGDSGSDATSLYAVPALLGDVYVGPYVEFEPELATVLTASDPSNRAQLEGGMGVGGYVLGCLDTRAFEARCEQEWWPRVRAEHPVGSAPDGSADARLVNLIHHPPVTPDVVVRHHPSHLHVDLLPQWQGGGWGRRLLDHLFTQLAEAGSPGVHLGVGRTNVGAIGFYERLGFTVLDDSDPGALFLGKPL